MLGKLLTLKQKAKEKKYFHEAVAAMARERNTSVLGLKLGPEFTVVVFGYQMAKQVCTREEFEGHILHPTEGDGRSWRCVHVIRPVRGVFITCPSYATLHEHFPYGVSYSETPW